MEARFDGRILAEQRSEGLVLTIPEVALFASVRAELADSAASLLAELARTFDSNWDLAAARANAVARSLRTQGFPPQRLHAVSDADTRPVADNGTPEGWAANRRVELKIELRPERSG